MNRDFTKDDIPLLFERLYEPITFPRGEDNVYMNVPGEYLSERTREIGDRLPSRFGARGPSLFVSALTVPGAPGAAPLPQAIEDARGLKRTAHFSVFIPWHRRLAAKLIELFTNAPTTKEVLSLITFARELCNPQLWWYAVSVTLLHRPDTRDIPLSALVCTMPSKILNGDIMGEAYRTASLGDSSQRKVVVIPPNWTATSEEPEQRLAYFREDVGINAHHWHWHLVYPFEGPDTILYKDRRGEMFYYMHQQVLARYNIERFSVGLGRVRRLTNLREPIQEGYYSKLNPNIAREAGYAGRPDNTYLSDVRREEERFYFDISHLERWDARIFDAIHSGFFINAKGERERLTEEKGIDVLGNMVEASWLSPNPNVYGDLHNLLHFFLGACHDPDGKHGEPIQPIGEPATAMRDPVFYPLHAYIDDMFRQHKHTLRPYTEEELSLPGLLLQAVEVQSSSVPGEVAPPARGELRTFLQESDIDVSRGLDFAPRGPVLVRVTHLQHAPFHYTFHVLNNTNAGKRVIARVFLAPKNDDRGIPLRFIDHKNYFVEVDKFVATVPPGSTQLKRESSQSSITIPWEQTFRDVDRRRPDDGTTQLQDFSYCSCGWPQHMLLPRGNVEGLPCVLFAMLTDYELDKVAGSEMEGSEVKGRCKAAVSFCGVRDKRFPDRRPMGFPFDRLPRDQGHSLADFMGAHANMRSGDVTVRFTNRTLLRRAHGAPAATPTFS